jgi:hypothetical protein
MSTEQHDFTPKGSAAKDRGPRLFVLIATVAMVAVIAYPLLVGRDGFIKTFPKMLSATPAPSASESPMVLPSATP